MKQLKFMLAAATAIGLATAAQAAVKTTYLVGTDANTPENFNAAELEGKNPVDVIAGYDFQPTAPATEADNESLIKDGALNVNTGTDPLLRALDWTGAAPRAVGLSAGKSLYIDTMVEFTVTPAGDTVTVGDTDKLLIYLKEGEEAPELRVKASSYVAGGGMFGGGADFSPEDVKVTAEGLSIVAKTQYRLTVTAYADALKFTVFEIAINGIPLVADVALYAGDDTRKLFPSLIAKKEMDAGSDPSLSLVGFAGEGKVDDLLVWTVEPQTSVDFTLALGDGVSAVEWTINEAEKSGEGSASFAAGTTIVVSIDSVTYEAGYAGTQDWTAWTYNKAESGSIEITAEKFADVSEGGVVTPTADAVDAVNAGSFKVPAATDDNAAAVDAAMAELGKALTWATSAAKGGKSYDAAIEAITAMNFTDETETATEQAYLLNCAPTEDAIKEKKDAFVFSAVTFDENGAPVVTVDPEFAGDVNGRIEIRGATSLDAKDAFTAPKKDGDAFFKAFLVK